DPAELLRRVEQLERINSVLMERVEQGMDKHADAFSLFQTATLLEDKVRQRTIALEGALERLEESNRALQTAKEEAEAAARSKDRFVASMSHELRTPLNAILGLSEILLESGAKTLSTTQRGRLEQIGESGRHLLALINDVLDLAKIGAGELRMEWEPVDVADLCSASLRFVAPQAEKRRLQLSSRVASDLGHLRSDGRRLKQVLVNLLSNAVKFTPEGGEVSLEATRSPDGASLVLTVKDTGIGIAEKDQSALFQPFFQVDNGLSRQYDGTGLGLALVHHMASELGGEVEVESVLSEGSTFRVRLPWTAWAEEVADDALQSSGGETAYPALADSDAATHARASGTARILVAEDNAINQEVILEMLHLLGYEAELATNGAEVVERFDPERHALILMDVQMPVVDGYEATRMIRDQSGKAAQTPIIALTANAQESDRQRCLEAGMNDHVSKPVAMPALRAVIERWRGASSAVV
ncbi:MAG: response regulator, partial [Gemmatimonadota bacterium]|nr:response regulator [Gemmatimonadota bacterium]